MIGIAFLILAVICSPHPLAMLFAIAIHELGHITASLLLSKKIPVLSFEGAGLKLKLYGTQSHLISILIALSGSFFGAIPALFSCFPESFRLYSLGFSILNLLPISALDGGCALLSFLEIFMLPDRACRISKVISTAAVLMFWAFSVAVQVKGGSNLTMLAVSVYLTFSVLTDG